MSTPPLPPRTQEDASAAGRGYVSPIPVRKPHLGDAVTAEWTKIRSLRATVWTLGVMVVLVVGIGLLVALVVRFYTPEPVHQPPLELGFFGVMVSLLCVIMLGVFGFSSEYSTGLIRSTLTACPSRGRVLAAKCVVQFSLVFVLALVVTSVTGVLQVVVLDAPNPDGDAWLGATAGVSLYAAVLGLLALAVGALLRHPAGAITAMIGVVLLPLVLALFLASTLRDVSVALLNYSIPSQLAQFYGQLGGLGGGKSPSAWVSLGLLLGLTAAALVGAYAALDRRDV